jgi:predicted Zn-dependent protease
MAAVGLVLGGCAGRKTAATDGGDGSRIVRPPIKEVSQQQLETEAALIDALSLQESGRTDEAMAAYAKLTAKDPACAAGWYELGRMAMQRGWTDSAQACLDRAVALQGDNTWYLLAKAASERQRGDVAAVARTWERIVDLNPEVLENHYELSNARLAAGDIEGAVGALNRVERMVGVTEQVSLQKHRLWMAVGKEDKALREVEALAAAMPKEKRYQAILAESYMGRKQYKKAKQCYDRIAALDPDDEYIHLQLAEYYKRTGKTADADREMETAFADPRLDCRTKLQLLGSFYTEEEFYGDRSKAVFSMLDKARASCGSEPGYALVYGDALLRQGRFAEAARQIETALAADSSRYEVWEALLISLSEDDSREADLERYAARAARLFPMKTLPCYLQALCAARRDDYGAALTQLDKAMKWGFANGYLEAETYGLAAEACYRTGNYDRAWHLFDRYLELRPDDWGMMNNYAYYLAERNMELDKAERMSRRTIEAEPGNANSLDTYAWILHLQGRDREAMPYMVRALNLNPSNETFLKHMEAIKEAQP